MVSRVPRYRVFISYHDEDREHKDRFVRNMGESIIDESVQVGDIDDTNRQMETIRRIIRDDYIADATVTIVLIGPCTWQRKHVDWEIGSSLRKTKNNSRCGLLGILLPHHPDHGKETYRSHLVPPRLADNCEGVDPFASICDLPGSWIESKVRRWVHDAFLRRRNDPPPDNSRPQFARNRGGPCSRGWCV